MAKKKKSTPPEFDDDRRIDYLVVLMPAKRGRSGTKTKYSIHLLGPDIPGHGPYVVRKERRLDIERMLDSRAGYKVVLLSPERTRVATVVACPFEKLSDEQVKQVKLRIAAQDRWSGPIGKNELLAQKWNIKRTARPRIRTVT